MKIAYLILAHDQPEHLVRLVQALRGEETSIFVHLDRKSDKSSFWRAKTEEVEFLRDRVAVHWGEFSQVEAILALLRRAFQADRRCGRFVLLSGSDYPLRTSVDLRRFFARYPETEFMDLVPMPSEKAAKPLDLLTSYRASSSRPWMKRCRRLAKRVGLPVVRERDFRRYLGDLQPFGGGTWWALTAGAVAEVLEFVERERRVTSFYRNAICPDEMLFHTIIGNGQRRNQIRRSLTFTDWSGGRDNPAWIGDEHVERFEREGQLWIRDVFGEGEALFARKFRQTRPDLLERVRQVVERRSGVGVGRVK